MIFHSNGCPSKALYYHSPNYNLFYITKKKNAKAFSNAHLQLPLRNDLPMQRYYRTKSEKKFLLSQSRNFKIHEKYNPALCLKFNYITHVHI